MKSRSDKPLWIGGSPRRRHFKQAFEFRLDPLREQELLDLLHGANLSNTALVRLDIKPVFSGFNDLPHDVLISFQHAQHAIWFKLAWVLCDITDPQVFGRVVLPVMRRVMPRVITQEIIGVQPMTGPTSQIFTLRAQYVNSAPASPLAQSSTLPSPAADAKDEGAPLGSS